MTYDATTSFTFVNNGHLYKYDGDSGTVTGQAVRDPIKYTPDRVNINLRSGDWQVIESVEASFPRAGLNAKYETSKVRIVGVSTYATDTWVVETRDGSLLRVHGSKLTTIKPDDETAFQIVADLGVSYQQAMKMINKGYGKL